MKTLRIKPPYQLDEIPKLIEIELLIINRIFVTMEKNVLEKK